MNLQDTIRQLEALRDDAYHRIDTEDPDCVFAADVRALTTAVQAVSVVQLIANVLRDTDDLK